MILNVINIIVLVVATVAIGLQFLLAHTQKEMNDMNSFLLTFNKFITSNKVFIREPDCNIRRASNTINLIKYAFTSKSTT